MKKSSKAYMANIGVVIAFLGFIALTIAPFTNAEIKSKAYFIAILFLAVYYSYFSIFVTDKWGLPPRLNKEEKEQKFDKLSKTGYIKLLKFLQSLSKVEIIIIILGFILYFFTIFCWMKMIRVNSSEKEMWAVCGFVSFLFSSSFLSMFIFRKGLLKKNSEKSDDDPIMESTKIKKRLFGFLLFIFIGVFNLLGYINGIINGAPIYRFSFFQLIILLILPIIIKELIKDIIRLRKLRKAINAM